MVSHHDTIEHRAESLERVISRLHKEFKCDRGDTENHACIGGDIWRVDSYSTELPARITFENAICGFTITPKLKEVQIDYRVRKHYANGQACFLMEKHLQWAQDIARELAAASDSNGWRSVKAALDKDEVYDEHKVYRFLDLHVRME